MKDDLDGLRADLKETMRRLGPYTQVHRHEPFLVNDAEIARRVQELIRIVLVLIDRIEKAEGGFSK